MDGVLQKPTASTVADMQTCKPILHTKDITDLLRRRYNIQIAELKEFGSYDDRTYYVKTQPGCGIGERSEFIAKVLNCHATAVEGVVDVQTKILDYLKSYPELSCQFALPNVNGDLVSYEMIPNDVRDGDVFLGREKRWSALRLFNFLPGKPIRAFRLVPSTFYLEAGIRLGKLQQTLQEFPGDIQPLKLKASSCWWCLSSVPLLRGLLPLVQDDAKQRLVKEVIDKFEATVVPVMDGLKKGIIQCDFSHDNILVTSSVKDTSDCGDNALCKFQITGVIDFDDTMYTCLVYEVAIAMMYAMFCCDEPILAAAYLLAGFEMVSGPVPLKERRLLKVLVAGRFAQSLVTSLVQVKNQPDNVYVGKSLVKGWQLLEKWWSQSEGKLQELWDTIKARCFDKHSNDNS